MAQQNCSLCRQPIVCNELDVANCACSTVNLLQETVDFLHNNTNHQCLCTTCLKNFDEWVKFALSNPFPTRMSQMQPVHFYTENGYFVFTEQYHVHKGNCCGNNCRHCVYQSKI